MKVVRVLAVGLLALLVLGAVAGAGYALGRGEVDRSPLRAGPSATATPDRCATEASAYSNAGNSSNSVVFSIARNDYQECRERYP